MASRGTSPRIWLPGCGVFAGGDLGHQGVQLLLDDIGHRERFAVLKLRNQRSEAIVHDGGMASAVFINREPQRRIEGNIGRTRSFWRRVWDCGSHTDRYTPSRAGKGEQLPVIRFVKQTEPAWAGHLTDNFCYSFGRHRTGAEL